MAPGSQTRVAAALRLLVNTNLGQAFGDRAWTGREAQPAVENWSGDHRTFPSKLPEPPSGTEPSASEEGLFQAE